MASVRRISLIAAGLLLAAVVVGYQRLVLDPPGMEELRLKSNGRRATVLWVDGAGERFEFAGTPTEVAQALADRGMYIKELGDGSRNVRIDLHEKYWD